MHKLMLLRPATLFTVVAALLAMSIAAHADTITIFSTGSGAYPGTDPNFIYTYVSDNPGVNPGVLASGTQATILNASAWPIGGINQEWTATPAGAKWIGPPEQFDGAGYLTATPNVYYIYQQTFNIQSGIDLTTVLLTGAIVSDNCPTTVAVNGQGPTGGSGSLMPADCTTAGNSFKVVHSFKLGGVNANFGSTAGLDYYANVTFHTGPNTIQFIVFNDNTPTANPTGVAVSLSGEALPSTVPEPSSAGLAVGAIGVAAWLRRRGSRRSV